VLSCIIPDLFYRFFILVLDSSIIVIPITIHTLVSLVPKPRVNLTRFHGVFAPNSKYRALVTPTKRGKGKKARTSDDAQYQTPTERRASMTWAQRLRRVFDIDVATCSGCGGKVKIIASIA